MVAALGLLSTACGETRATPRTDGPGDANTPRERGRRLDERAGILDVDIPEVTARNAAQSLAFAAGLDPRAYRVVRDTAALPSGSVTGSILFTGALPPDAAIVPTHDRTVCRPFTDTLIPSADGGVGHAVVWLVGVTQGPAIGAPRRVALALHRCRLSPRVLVVAVGGTLQLTSRDAMQSRLRFSDVGRASPVRALVPFGDAGQVVPTSSASLAPGLVEVRDDLHPWVRGYVAIAPHPFVAVTSANGGFRFDGVPAGRYTLVVWQEKLGVRLQTVRVTPGVELRVRTTY